MTPDPNLLNLHLRALVRPPDWRNPVPAARYDMVVIGGGTAGLVCAAGAAGVGARVAIVERALLGGECLNTGCVPSKALLRAAALRLDFPAAMARARDARVALAPNDSAARLRSLGVDVFFGDAMFASDRTVTSGDVTLAFRRAVIATGSRPAVPAIGGLAGRAYLTNETMFELHDQPRALVIVGGGAVGCEMAQAFARLGTRVTIVEHASRILPREDADAAAILAQRLAADGVDIRTGTDALPSDVLTADPRILVAAGRSPNVERLGLDRAGVAVGARGVQVDDRLRTTNPRIFASGDVCGDLQFTHAADAMSRIVVQNALFFGRKRWSDAIVPWCVFTSPELAHVGITADDARVRGAQTITVPLDEVDRAVIDDQTAGFVRVHHHRGRILGATMLAPAAGELIAIVTAVMRRKGTLADLSSTIFPYPTLALGLKRAGDAFRRESLTPRVRRMLQVYFRLWH